MKATVIIHEVDLVQPDLDDYTSAIETQNRNELAHRISAAIRNSFPAFDKDKDEITVIVEQNEETATHVDPADEGSMTTGKKTAPKGRKK